jgi:hypothetical protein
MADHDTAFSCVKELVAHAVTLAHPAQDYELCLFTAASDFHWGIILTQVPKKQVKVSVRDHSKKITNLFVAVAFIAESMTSHLSLSLWEKQYMELHQTKFFTTTFSIFKRVSRLATSRLNTF